MSDKKVASTLTELYPYIMGKEFFGETKNVPRIDPEYYKLFLTMLEQDSIAKNYFEAFDIYDDFFKTMTDFNHFIPAEQRPEVYYAAKVGKAYRHIPSFCMWVLLKAWEQSNGIPNLILKYIPVSYLHKFCSKGYFLGGLNLHDVICNVCTDQFIPFDTFNLKHLVKVDDKEFYEVYIRETDMVAAVPKSIGELLTNDAIANITVSPNGLLTQGLYVRTMGGRVGAVNSVYDLREVI